MKQFYIFLLFILLPIYLSGVVYDVHHYQQDGQSWSGDQLGTCNGVTLGSHGCGVTCVAMLLKTTGVDVDPGQLNDWLTDNNHYYSDCLLNSDAFNAIEQYPGSQLDWFGYYSYSLTTLKNEIDAGNPVITRVNYESHFVVIKGYDGSGNQISDYKVADPLFTYETNLSSYTTIDGFRIYHNVNAGTNSPPSLILPANESAFYNGDSDILFDWSNFSGASYYDIWIDNDYGFGSPAIGFDNGSGAWIADGIVSISQFTLTTVLQSQLNQNTYFWYVRALDSGQNPITDWSAIREFDLLDNINPTIINVPADQPTIQAGIDAAVNDDIVLVQPGTYVENINFNGKNITVASLYYTTQDIAYISQTVIDGNQNGSVVTFESGEESTAVLSGFTIINGSGKIVSGMPRGGGIYCYNSSPTVKNAIISGNILNGDNPRGGGIFCEESSMIINETEITDNTLSGLYPRGGGISCRINGNPLISNVTISGNYVTGGTTHAASGGGISMVSSNPFLNNVIIANNTVVDFSPNINTGGGIEMIASSSPNLVDVLIYENTSESGGGIRVASSSPSLQNVTITRNNAESGGGIFCSSGTPVLINSILWDNTPQEISYYTGVLVTATYSDIQGGWTGEGNIDNDPLFVNPANGEYYLTEYSPCIDAGDPNSSYDPDGTIADMGAFYFDQTQSTLIVDFSADQTIIVEGTEIQFTDLSTGSPTSWQWDFNNDSILDSYEQNPAWTYNDPGLYTVTLTVSDGTRATDTETKIDYISVLESLALYSPANESVFYNGDSDILFDWSNVSGASYYDIWIDNDYGFGSPAIGFDNGSGAWIADGIVSSSQFTLTTTLQSQLNQNTYFWHVRALDSGQNPITDWSAYREFDLLDLPDLLPPNNVTIFIVGDAVHLNWNPVDGANSYNVYTSDDPYTGFELDETGTFDGTSWTAINLDDTRFYHVTAIEETNYVTDIDGNVYQTVQIGDQLWMAENLKVIHYRNGDAIPHITDNGDWLYPTNGAYCVYDNTPSNSDTYGNLYNWDAVDDSRGLAPEGWHIPTDGEIKELEMALGMSEFEANDLGWRGTNEGSKLAGGYDLWYDGTLRNDPEFDTSGFSLFPGGYRSYENGTFNDMGYNSYLWSATDNTYENWGRRFDYNHLGVGRDDYNSGMGISVRCVRD